MSQLICLEKGLVRIAGEMFPTCTVICPRTEKDIEAKYTDEDMSLSDPGRVIIPAENGTLFEIGPERAPAFRGDGKLLFVYVSSPVCSSFGEWDELSWLPQPLILDGRVLKGGRPGSVWNGAEPEWVVEHIRRLSCMPVVDLVDGPLAKIVTNSAD
jgi:hypothetical protein